MKLPGIVVLSMICLGQVQTPMQAQTWDALVDRFFEQAEFRFNPTAGTSAGFHQYDTQLEDFSGAAIRQRTGTLHQYEREVENFPAARLTPEQAADRDLVLSHIRSSLLDLESIRRWERDPDYYSTTA